MKNLLKYSSLLIIATNAFIESSAQLDTGFIRRPLPITSYLSLVGKQNLNYVAQQFNVNIADAGIESAKVFPDPQLSAGAFNNDNASTKLGYGYDASLVATIELGGKRKARIDLATSQADLSKLLLEDYFRNLRADASLAYFNAMQQYHLFTVQAQSFGTMKQLADADSIRFKLGAITEIDARQSKLEAGSLLNSLYQNEADWKNALIQLHMFTGNKQTDTLLTFSGDFDKLERNFSLIDLISTAQNKRADVLAALKNKNVSEKTLQLVKANRKIDLGVNIGATYNTESNNAIAPTPAYSSINAGIAIPLKFSNKYKGDIKAATYTIQQSQVQYDELLLEIQVQVTQAYLNYTTTQKQVMQFKNGLLEEAAKVLTGKIYSYKRGETSLLEVLNAQRTYNDVQQNYYQSLFNYASALVELERTCGTWDIQ